MPIDIKDVEKIAELANLTFTAEELEPFAHQFQEILNYIAQLEGVPTEKIEPTYHALAIESPQTPVRKDEAKPSVLVDEALANAPDRSDGYFRVPKVIE